MSWGGISHFENNDVLANRASAEPSQQARAILAPFSDAGDYDPDPI